MAVQWGTVVRKLNQSVSKPRPLTLSSLDDAPLTEPPHPCPAIDQPPPPPRCMQGFTKQISMAHDRWVGYIKDYDGGTLMECCILQNGA